MASTAPTVAIIGGGMSGIKAAIDLGQAGIKAVILEARDRLGGRIINTTKNGITYDLGPSWLHDAANNELMPYAAMAGVRFYYDDHEPQLYGPEGQVDKEQADWAAARFYTAVKKDFGDDAANASSKDMTLKDYIEKYIARDGLSDFERRFVPQIARMKELWHAIGWDRISCRYLEYAEATSPDAFILDSFVGILEQILAILERTPNVSIELNSEVSKVITHPHRDRSSNYSLKTKDGRQIDADYVVVTIPVMVLKKIHRTLFEPRLSSSIVRAIELTDTARLGKTYIRFESAFWDIEKRSYNICGNGEPDGPGSHVVSFVNAYPMFKKPVLLAITSPPLTTILEIGGINAMKYLEHHFKSVQLDRSKPLPKVVDVVTTDWSQDRLTLGSYSALPVGVHPEDIVDPFVKGNGNMRFAGEHTVKEASGCVHGAFQSGEREAAYILKREVPVSRL